MGRPIRIVNVADLGGGEAFVDLPAVDGRPLAWTGHAGTAVNALERAIRRPKLSRYRAAFAAARDAARADAVISHLPRMTAAVEHFAGLRRRRAPHLAFSFNFTDLPVAGDRRRLARALSRVERFCVFSTHEAGLYADAFGLDPTRFAHVMWGQSAPAADPSAPVPDRPFVVAIGGEGRDYAGILAAARAAPDVTWLVIARPTPLFDNAPANLHARFNVPAPLTWGIARRAAAVVVPLVGPETCCGHITIASTQLSGVPLITTASSATREYTEGFAGTTVVPPGDPGALAAAARAAIADPATAHARADLPEAERRYDRGQWAHYIADFLRAHLA